MAKGNELTGREGGKPLGIRGMLDMVVKPVDFD
jgi:hypothetical protein